MLLGLLEPPVVVGAAVVVDRERDRGVLVVLPEADLGRAGLGRPGDFGNREARLLGLAERAQLRVLGGEDRKRGG